MSNKITTTSIELSKLFIDAVEKKITLGEVKHDHGAEGPGYQRDPYRRIDWLTKRAAGFNKALLRTIEVSARGDGTFAIIDGGGRWVMCQLAKRKVTEVECHVHYGLTREEEAKLFYLFDHEIYRLRGIDNFLALWRSGDKTAEIIFDATKPYTIAVAGKGTLKCVGQLTAIKQTPHGIRIINSTSAVLADAWGDYDPKTGTFGKNGQGIDGKMYVAVAMILDAVLEAIENGENGWTPRLFKQYEGFLRDLLGKPMNSIKSLLKAPNLGDAKTIPATLIVSQNIAKKLGILAGHADVPKVTANMLASGRLFESYATPLTYSSRIAAERLAQQAADDYAELG